MTEEAPLTRQIGCALRTAYGVGIMVGAGTVATAAVLRGGVGDLTSFVDLPFLASVIGPGVLLTGIAIVNAALIGVERTQGSEVFSVSALWPWAGLRLSLATFVAGSAGESL